MNTTNTDLVQSKPAIKAVPDGVHTVTPHLTCAGAADAIEFYKQAFGAIELMRIAGPEGELMHGAVRIGDSMVMLNDEFPSMGALSPKARGGSSVTIHLSVDDVEVWFKRATEAGATVVMPVADMFWGDRYGIVADPFGHLWSIATHVRDMLPEQLQEAARNACCGGSCNGQNAG